MKFSKHVETCFVRANDDFDDKSTYIYCFLNKKKLLDKNPQKRTLCNIAIKKQKNLIQYAIYCNQIFSDCDLCKYSRVFDSKPSKLLIKTKIIFNVHGKSGLDW